MSTPRPEATTSEQQMTIEFHKKQVSEAGQPLPNSIELISGKSSIRVDLSTKTTDTFLVCRDGTRGEIPKSHQASALGLYWDSSLKQWEAIPLDKTNFIPISNNVSISDESVIRNFGSGPLQPALVILLTQQQDRAGMGLYCNDTSVPDDLKIIPSTYTEQPSDEVGIDVQKKPPMVQPQTLEEPAKSYDIGGYIIKPVQLGVKTYHYKQTVKLSKADVVRIGADLSKRHQADMKKRRLEQLKRRGLHIVERKR